MSSNFNYAKAVGVESVAAAVVFAVLYAPPSGWFIFQLVSRRIRTLIILSLFCLVRLTAFILRAYLAGSESGGENLNILIGEEVLFSIGFFGLLLASYTLVLDRLEFVEEFPRTDPLNNITRNRRIFRLVLLAGVILGIVGLNLSTSGTHTTTGEALRKASVIVFFVLTVLQVYQTAVLVSTEILGGGYSYKSASASIGARHGAFIFGAISVLLLIRETFLIATINSIARQNNEHFWYPLVAVPEFLCVALYTIPGLIPTKNVDDSELPK